MMKMKKKTKTKDAFQFKKLFRPAKSPIIPTTHFECLKSS